jgi:hypothetical protein
MIKGKINSIKNLFLLKIYIITMKRLISVIILLLLITSCDDGNLTVDVIDFSEGPVVKCSDKDVFYKIKDSEMLFIEIPDATFEQNQTLDGVPIELSINTTNKVTYRKYLSTVSPSNICGNAPDASPNLVEQWKASDGIIQITATAIKTTNATTNATEITGYRYYIELKNITFQKPSGPQLEETLLFGNYTTSFSPLAFDFDDQVAKSTCSLSDNRIFNFNGSEVFFLDVGSNYATLFANAVTTTPRTAIINTTNKLTYRLYNNAITNAFFCTTTSPTTPILSQEWNAVTGVEAVSGIIEVSTTTLGNGFQHTIHFKKVTLKKENSDFTLGDDYIFGSFVTNP